MKALCFCSCILAVLLISPAHAPAGQPERLLGISTDYSREQITIEVVGTGCTQKEDFRFEYKENTLTVIRKNRDSCKAMPQKISLVFTLQEAGLDRNKPFRVSNAFIANHHLAGL